MQDRRNRLFEDSVRGAGPEAPDDLVPGNWTPAVDSCETGNAVILKAEPAGLQRKTIDISVS